MVNSFRRLAKFPPLRLPWDRSRNPTALRGRICITSVRAMQGLGATLNPKKNASRRRSRTRPMPGPPRHAQVASSTANPPLGGGHERARDRGPLRCGGSLLGQSPASPFRRAACRSPIGHDGSLDRRFGRRAQGGGTGSVPHTAAVAPTALSGTGFVTAARSTIGRDLASAGLSGARQVSPKLDDSPIAGFRPCARFDANRALRTGNSSAHHRRRAGLLGRRIPSTARIVPQSVCHGVRRARRVGALHGAFELEGGALRMGCSASADDVQ